MKTSKTISVSDKIKIWTSRNQIIKAAAAAHHDKGTNGTAAEDDGTADSTKDPVALRRDAHHKDSALNQCINELTSNLHQRRCVSSSDVPAPTPTSPTSKSSTSSPTSTMTSGGAGGQVVNSSSQPDSESEQSSSRSRRSSQSEALLSSPSHFVTVIEVKESSEKTPQEQDQPQSAATKRNSVAPALPAKSSSVTAGDSCNNNNSSPAAAVAPLPVAANPRPNSYENVLINTNRGSCENLNNNSVVHGGHVIHQQNNNSEHSTFLDNNGSGGGQGVAKYPKPSAPPMTMGSSIADRTSQLIGSGGGGAQDLKKKVPPRPPPKYPRRAAPVEPPVIPAAAMQNLRRDQQQQSSDGTPDSSLERNLKPSEIYRQKSSDSLDVKLRSSRTASELAEEFAGRPRLPKSDSLKSKSSTDSPTGSLGKNVGASPTGSLGKLAHTAGSSDSPTGSLGKKESSLQSVGSRESLASTGGGGGMRAISERIKSYESISSISSDSMREGTGGSSSGAQVAEQEHYYDTVPLENGEGDYVYIQAGGTGSTSSRDDISTAGSTLPLPASHPRSHNSSQTSVQLEPESPGRSSNYVNIDYFIHSQNHENRSSSIDSDGEADGGPPVLLRAISNETDSGQAGHGIFRKISNANRNTIIRHIVTSIITSETLYVECLNKMKQYMKAIRATLTTSQPVISEEEFQTIFFKIEELHEVHSEFLGELKVKLGPLPEGDDLCVGEVFRRLAAHIHLYGAFLHNYGRAIDTVKKCSTQSQQFKEIVSNIVFKNQNEQSLSLEELLHKPVARVQKNALVLEDLLNQTPEQHPDYHPLRQATKTIRNFLSEFNVVQTKSMFPSDDKALRRLVKNSFIVELADGHRKLRHLFLFNDVIACAKYKAAGRDRNGFEFELKWFIPLRDILICEESANDPKETSPINIVHLKSQACTVRDQIMLDEKDERKARSSGSRAGDKHRKKLADLEAQLVLASPNLVFKIGNKATSKTMTFFLSSDFERTQWIESILTLQQSCNLPGQTPVQIYDLQAWITACQALIKTEMGSYLMRNARDESLLVGDLHLTIQGLAGFEQPCDLFICVEIDSYGHYFRKAKTKLVCRSASPCWNESFVLELEGSQNLRVLLYQDDVQRPILRAKQILKLSRQWLQEAPITKVLRLSETLSLNTVIRFVPGEVTLRRVPTSKPGALFGAKLAQVIKREKRDIPFIVSACVREVERRGMAEVGIYRVSGSASDVAKLKKSFETNAYEAEQLLKEVDIHSVTGILKSYLRDLPEALFTDQYYPKFFETFNRHSNLNEASRIEALQKIFAELPQPNKATIHLLLDHLMRVHQQEIENKMSLHNLAMVFGPTLLRPGPTASKQKDLLESSTADVMTQAGILYSFLQARLK
ncbi:active breakpoint cluster region-related protein isoform X3 [Culex quinquefasciatus]|uniref:active breakpoint cluster region-related protein isoform X3 n=1 Tax=Culex quinquefasciatus TaxID=7176 RepID=UPI0018E3AF8B|nr:active breakpoint cluster region-related protein isoform X3 [Culex quinquefasciatus]XP_038104089.1 active breakpoint cluster region-related protein isoform X3 [Culex quinquefasciatus]XP_038104090.1 active breakpoint cluster region-related protein isoform X3 [Culex quinquefasciatus]XP_038104092.1 active breakpoint cluster region-related protein isoform X3 [Culex quinquefasciatus]XP_038104093.1 active breakpoint cluster region-related protein isoform X3 [Culex quinquefasciatus]XP_038104094.1 